MPKKGLFAQNRKRVLEDILGVFRGFSRVGGGWGVGNRGSSKVPTLGVIILKVQMEFYGDRKVSGEARPIFENSFRFYLWFVRKPAALRPTVLAQSPNRDCSLYCAGFFLIFVHSLLKLLLQVQVYMNIN